MFRAFLSVLLSISLSAAAVGSTPAEVSSTDARVDHSVRRLLDARSRGELVHHVRAPGRLVAVETVAAVIRLNVPATPEILADLEARGATLFRAEGRPLSMGPFVQVRLPLDAVDAVAASPQVRRIEAHAPVRPTGWDDKTHTGTGLEQVWDLVETDTGDLLGEGVTLGLIDSWIDIYHPAFFNADGGRYDWLDLDGDGLFTPGVDGVDLDADGVAGDAEVLQVLGAPITWSSYTTGTVVDENVDDGYQPDQDWLWADTNLSAVREFGSAAGFVEETPGYGEPIFVGDDVDGSGTIDPGEMLLRLGTSKIRKIYRPEKDDVYIRGDNLIEYPAWGASISHATMTAGVMVGSLPVHQRRHGVATAADVLLVDWEMDQLGGEDVPYGDPLLAGLVWLIEEGADVTSHSYGLLMGEFCDGSSELEQALDYVFENSSIPACVSSGNEGAYPYHGITEIPAGELVEIPVSIGLGEHGSFMIRFSLRWHDEHEALTVALEGPDGTQVEILHNGSDSMSLGDGASLRSFGLSVSERGTSILAGMLRNPESSWQNPVGLPGGDYKLLVLNNAAVVRTLDVIFAPMFTPDSVLLPTIQTGMGTVTWPSTADKAFSVGASVFNEGAVEDLDNEGTLAGYSSQGPRIDGELALDIVAPCDLAAPWKGYHETYLESVNAPPEYYELLDPYYPMYHSASGTSGAAPFAAAVMALWIQANPDGDPRELPELLRASATEDVITGEVPNPTWGYGKINPSRLLLAQDPAPNLSPSVTATAPAEVRLGEPFEVIFVPADAEDPPEALALRWDPGYDGIWDIPYGEEMLLDVEGLEEPGLWRVVAQVRDSLGGTARVLVQVMVLDEPFEPVIEAVVEAEGADVITSGDDTVDSVDVVSVEPIEGSGGSKGGCQTGTSAVAPWVLFAALLLVGLRRRLMGLQMPGRRVTITSD